MTALPGALEAIESGVLTVEQSSVVVTQLRVVTDLERRLALWGRLLDRLRRPEGAVLPPSRLRELLQGWIAAADDHPPPPGDGRSSGGTAPRGQAAPPGSHAPDTRDPVNPAPSPPGFSPAPTSSHPPGTPGPYAVTGLLRELIFLRAPRCEFPGCGVQADSCDAEHDLAWPDGPTCACNLGPCCRRHHRIKQQGWTKTRQHDSAVLWTSPTGRTRLSPSQHPPPAPPLRRLPALPTPHPLDELSPTFADDELWLLLDRPDDPQAWELRASDVEPDDVDPDPLGADTRWTLDLTDPYAWTDQPAPA